MIFITYCKIFKVTEFISYTARIKRKTDFNNIVYWAVIVRPFIYVGRLAGVRWSFLSIEITNVEEEEEEEEEEKKKYKGIQRKTQAATNLLALTRLLAVSTLLHYDELEKKAERN